MSTLKDRINAPKVPVVPAEPSLAGFVAWLETKNPAEEYRYSNPQTCAVGKYFESLGIIPKYFESLGIIPSVRAHSPYQEAWARVGWVHLNPLASPQPHSYGALLTRAKAELAAFIWF